MNHNAIQYHEARASRWEQNYARSTYARRAEAFMAVIPTPQHEREEWLDAGCGTGTLARLLADRGYRVTAVDGSSGMVEATRRLMQHGNYAVQCLQVADVAELPFKDGSFDGVIFSSVLEYVAEPRKTLLELARVLKQNGHLAISVPNRLAWPRQLQKVAYRVTTALGRTAWPPYLSISNNEFTMPECFRLLESCGFTPRSWRYYTPGLPAWAYKWRYAGTLMIIAAQKNAAPAASVADTPAVYA